jgi:SAM-dependent methyltransferase
MKRAVGISGGLYQRQFDPGALKNSSKRRRSAVPVSAFKNEVRRHFDERADRYDHDTQTCDAQDFINFRTVIPYLIQHSGELILEVATGTGIILESLLAAGKDAFGVDFSSGLLKVAETKRSIPGERLSCGDAEQLAFSDRSFDSVCVFRSLHHMEDQKAVIREMIRCSRKSVFIYDSAGEWRRAAKRALTRIGIYQPLYSLLRGNRDTGYRPANDTEGPVKVFYAEDVIPILKREKLRIVKVMRLHSNLFIHAEK